jgi:hypothetical protein
VKVRKTLNLRVRILVDANLPGVNNDNNPGQVIKKADVEAEIARMKELYAQIGIKVVEDITVDTVPAAEPGEGGLPKVDLTNGLTTMTGNDGNLNIILSDEMKALLKNTGSGRTPAVGANLNGEGGVADVEVYYVNRLTLPGMPANAFYPGQSYPRNLVKDADEKKHADAVVRSADVRVSGVLAHEVFHVLDQPG